MVHLHMDCIGAQRQSQMKTQGQVLQKHKQLASALGQNAQHLNQIQAARVVHGSV